MKSTLFLLLPIALAAQQPKAELDLVYAKNDSAQKLDLYVPARKGFATLVYTYGGGWHAGSGKSSTPIAVKLQGLGYGCALVSHRLSPPHLFPAHAEDVAAAFAWVRSHIAERGGDPARVILAGHSSGAHLSLLVASNRRYLAVHNLSPDAVAAVVGLSTPVDLAPRPGGRGYGDVLLAGRGADAFNRDRELMRDASPVEHVSATLPPTLLMVGEHDFPMLAGDAQAFVRKAEAAGRKVELELIAGKDHMDMARGMLDENDPVLRRVLEFLRKTVR